MEKVACSYDAATMTLSGSCDGTIQTDEFTIGLTIPVVEVTYDNNEAQNGSYYKKTRTATIAIEEKNFDEERTIVTITAKKQGQPVEAPAVSAFTTTEDMNTTPPEFTVEGVGDKTANQGTVLPAITYSDINLDNEPEITLTGANLGKVNYD